MKAYLTIPEDDVILEFDNLVMSTFAVLGIVQYSDTEPTPGEIVHRGEPIVLITSNMPEILRNKIEDIVSNYCHPFNNKF